MKAIVFAPETCNLAETSRMLVIARACKNQFTFLFTSYGGDFTHLVEDARFPLRKLNPQLTPEKIEHLYKADRMESMADPFTVGELTARVESEIALFQEVKPAAVVMGFTLSMAISARVAGIPLVCVIPLAGSRPFYEAGLGTWPDAFDYPILRWVPRSILDWVGVQWIMRTRMWTRSFNQVSQAFGGPEFTRLLDLFAGDYNLVTDVPEITGVSELPPGWHYVGPIIAQLDVPVPEEIASLPHDKPVIYFAMGSSGNRDIVREIIQGFGEKPYRVIAPVKSHLKGVDAQIPDNVWVTDWIPAHKVNPMADVSAIHGGQGTVQTACLSGTPIVGVGMQPEQEANLDFLVRRGMAIRIRKRRVAAQAILDAIDQLLADENAYKAAQVVQRILESWDGPGNVARFLLETFGNES